MLSYSSQEINLAARVALLESKLSLLDSGSSNEYAILPCKMYLMVLLTIIEPFLYVEQRWNAKQKEKIINE
jgi:hypothetical protein